VFANDTNHECQRFLALPRRFAEGAATLDGLRYSWVEELLYVLLPLQQIPRMLRKIRRVREALRSR
jgi:hypothetical protein